MGTEDSTGISQEGPDLLTSGENQANAGDNQNKPESGSTADQTKETGDITRPAWMAQLSGDLKESKGLTKFQNISELGKAYGELEGKLGNTISIPGDEATEQELADFYGKTGRPESAEKYDLKYEDAIPDYLKTALSKSEGNLKEALFKSGVSQKAAEGIFNWVQKELYAGEKLEATFREKQKVDGTEVLKKEWGASYDANLNVMSMAVNKFADEGFIKFARESGLVNNPDMIKTFLKIGQAMSEDTLVDGDTSTSDLDLENHTLKW